MNTVIVSKYYFKNIRTTNANYLTFCLEHIKDNEYFVLNTDSSNYTNVVLDFVMKYAFLA